MIKISEALKRMANEYRVNAALLLDRIDELKDKRAKLKYSTEYVMLNRRIAILESLYAESVSTARYLENYHNDSTID